MNGEEERGEEWKLKVYQCYTPYYVLKVHIHLHTDPNASCANGDIRLVGGASQYEGRVEVCIGDNWINVCAGRYSWNDRDAEVVCRQLGFDTQCMYMYVYIMGYCTYLFSQVYVLRT